MNTNKNPFGPYSASTFRVAIDSCFNGGKIYEKQVATYKDEYLIIPSPNVFCDYIKGMNE